MRHAIVHGPAFADLRPLKDAMFVEPGRTTFPVHPELPRLLREDKASCATEIQLQCIGLQPGGEASLRS
ncbi:hypothetical protein [Streptomyces sp. NPDC051684]|uniref:hypothetical protein n=1 Tax=Streptomyces sp. NPDC051684 TaxID=3365670 RepID=UPI0037A89641